MKLGIDVGRVLISPGIDSAPDTSFIGGTLEDALRTPPYPGMFEEVPRLVERFHKRVWLISKCGPSVQHKTRLWLAHQRFFERRRCQYPLLSAPFGKSPSLRAARHYACH